MQAQTLETAFRANLDHTSIQSSNASAIHIPNSLEQNGDRQFKRFPLVFRTLEKSKTLIRARREEEACACVCSLAVCNMATTSAAATTMADASARASTSPVAAAASATTAITSTSSSSPLPPHVTTHALDAKALIDEIVPPSDVSASPPSSPPHCPAHSPLSSPHAHAIATASPRGTPPHTPPHAAAAAVDTKPAAAAAATVAAEIVDSRRPRLKVVIPPVPPFLHEVDKRIEREHARLMQLSGASDSATENQQQLTDIVGNEDDAAFRTPEKQPQPKRKARSSDATDESEPLLVFHESEYRRSQITPPPSERMLDYKNPPLPPRKAKKRRRLDRPVNPVTGRMTFTALPRLSLSSETSSTTDYSQSSPPRLDTPPGSPDRMASVFRSLADEFAAVQDTPPLRTLRAPPRITRAARQCTPPISSRTRSAIQTPTTTMVLRSRQLNPSKTA